MDKGVKYDGEKNRVDLIPPRAIEAIGRALTHGAKKYEARNWEKGLEYSRLYGATLRHLLDWWDGSEEDEDSGLHPLDHAICDLAMLIEMRHTHPELDDRPQKDLTDEEKEDVKSAWKKVDNYGAPEEARKHPRDVVEYEKVNPAAENNRKKTGMDVNSDNKIDLTGKEVIKTNFGTLIVETPYEQQSKGSKDEEKV